jgi:type IV pilus assembly protein PilA
MVLVIVAVLLAIAVPSYLGFKERAARRAAAADVRSAVPSLEAYYSDVGTYAGATPAGLRASYDAGLGSIVLSGLSSDAYVVARTVDTCTATLAGPGGEISVSC